MNKSIDQLLIAAAQKPRSSQAFSERVMKEITANSLRPSRVMTKGKGFSPWRRLHHLPKFAAVLLAILALITVSGTVYAVYLLWPKPQANTSAPVVNNEGRTQLEVTFEQCGNLPKEKSYELKKGASVTADQIPGIIKARCELDAIGTWAKKQFPDYARHGMPGADMQSYTTTHPYISMAMHLLGNDGKTITFEGLKKYNLQNKQFPVTGAVQYIAEGKKVTADKIPTGSAVVYITKQSARMVPEEGCNEKHCSIRSEDQREELFAVIKLELPFESYDQLAWQSLAERTPCLHNEQDTCVSSGGIDLYMRADSNAGRANDVYKEVEGKLKEVAPSHFTLVATSGRVFTVQTSSDVIGNYNRQRSSGYGGITAGKDDVVQVGYYAPKGEESLTVTQASLSRIMLKIELVGKSDPLKKY